jgi:predicted outer membrane protein
MEEPMRGLTLFVILLFASEIAALAASDAERALERLPPSDRAFVSEVLSSGRLEMALGQAVLQTSADEELRRFAQHTMEDRERINAQVLQVLRSHGITLLPAMTPYQRETVGWVTRLAAADFNREYLQLADMDQESMTEEVRHEAGSGQDPALRALARSALSLLEVDRAKTHRLAEAETKA